MIEAEILGLIGLEESDVERYRGCVVDGNKIVVFARTGGDNREVYSNKHLTKNPYYLYDEDDCFDDTYANYYFRKPRKKKGVASE